MFYLDLNFSVVSLALICSFTRMRNHLGLGDVKPDEVPEETLLAVAETLRKSSFLKLSEDGMCSVFWEITYTPVSCVMQNASHHYMC